MHDEDQVPTPGAEEQVTNTAEEETPTTACDPADDPDLAEDEDSDNDGDAGETVAAD